MGYTQDYIRVSTGIDPSRIESGKTEPGLSRFISLCKGLKVSPGMLLVISEKNKTKSLSEEELLDVIKNWDEYQGIFSIARDYVLHGIHIKFSKKAVSA